MGEERFIVLLRGINVGGRSLPMAALRAAAQETGIAGFATYIQSGNLLLSAEPDAGAMEARIEALIHERFALRVEAIARTARDFAAIAATNPFPDALPRRSTCASRSAHHATTRPKRWRRARWRASASR